MPTATCLTTRSHTTSLLASVAAGDEGAMARIWSEYARPVHSLARSLSKATASDADDVVQETLAKVWKAAGSFDPTRGTETTFVFTIARRVIIDRWRKSRCRPAESAFDDRHPVADERSAEVYDRLLVGPVVWKAVATLPTIHREVVELAYVHGLTQQEIALELGVPLGTVKTRTFAALRLLRTRLADHDLTP